ncbi:TPR repeat protein [Fulvivirga imtechensis AK7]|uniref:TPR repeat protein n=1 Tax=Fulvivirga imtechensis AK7 TaxID=1237149 RepID=L8JPR8_9BACT|nr:tetratricopeptide repeat protein [Fulvivirga imtechensis]ELR70815.1 TPR repeat protein [Fulvivirga imtechensis AK7]
MQLKYSLVLLVFISITSWGQNTLYHSDNNTLYRKGLELLDKADYTAARETFERYVAESGSDIRKADAEYYIAFSALSLYHADGEKLIEHFIRNHNSHPKAVVAYYELGSFYFAQKDYGKAVKYLSRVDLSLVTEKQRQETRFKLGYAHFSQREFTEALNYFNVLKRQSGPYASASSYYAGYIEYENGEYDKAVADLQRAEENDAYKPVVPGMIANIYYKQKRYDDLISYSNKILSGPGRVNEKDFYLLTADAYLNKRDFKKAAEYYEQYDGLMKNPTPDIRYRIGYTNFRLGNNQEAITQLKQAASDRDSIGVYASYYLGVLYLKEGNKIYALTAFDNARKNKINRSLREEGAYQYAKISYDLGRSEEAITGFNEFITSYPSSEHIDEVNDLLSEAYLNSSNYNLAIDHIEKMKSMNRSMEKVYQKATFLKGAELFNKGDYRAAIDLFKKSLKYPIDPQFTAMANLWAAEAYSVGRKYEEATGHYQAILGSSYKNSPHGLQARYGLGYAYYNTKAYDKALIHFKEYVNQLEKASDKGYYDDALLRLADTYYVTKSYDNALNYYRKAIQQNKADNDYAHLQAGIVMGIQGNVSGAKGEYDYIVSNYPKSRYIDDALFQKAQLNFEKGNYEEATQGFSNLIAKRPSSQFVPYAYMRRASAYYNMKQYDKSITDYKKILDEYPTHSIASDVLLPLQEVLNLQNRSSEFDSYLAMYKKANPEKKGVESIEFETAKNQYFNLDYKKSISSFRDYIRSYPDNPKVPEAKYYIAESHYRLKEFDPALEIYNQLISEGSADQLSRITHRIAEIEFRSGRYENAAYFYYKLGDAANNKKEEYYAWAGLMESYFLLGKYDSTKYYANIILERGNVNISSQNKASLYLGKAAYAKGDFETAKDEFLSTLNTAKDEHGAEAQFLLGQIFYQNKQYQQSIEALIELNNSFNVYEEWVGKAYLLLADNYRALGDFFQAKGTLKSIIENFPLEHIRKKAQSKLTEIEQQEKKKKEEVLSTTDSLTIDIKDIDN